MAVTPALQPIMIFIRQGSSHSKAAATANASTCQIKRDLAALAMLCRVKWSFDFLSPPSFELAEFVIVRLEKQHHRVLMWELPHVLTA